jgi:signal transduction histidine kinase
VLPRELLARSSSVTPQVAPWLRVWVFAVLVVLTIVTVLTAFTDEMPESHHAAASMAAVVMFAAWAVELSGVRWPRVALIALTIVPNVLLTLMGHFSANNLFLLLLVAWLGVVGKRWEHVLALVLSLGVVGLGIAVQLGAFGIELAGGPVAWTAWIINTIVVVMAWLMGLLVRRQEQLLAELGVLLTVSRSVASTLEMRGLLDSVLDALGSVVDYSGAAIFTLDETGDTLAVAHVRGPGSFGWQGTRPMHYAVADLLPTWDRLARDEPVVIADIRAGTPDADAFRRLAGGLERETADGSIRSVMWVPLVVRGRITGNLGITSPAPNAYGPREATLALAIGRQAAVAIDNARLHERARQAAILEERQRLARELHDSVTQSLYGISLYAEAAERALADGDTAPVATNLHDIGETTREALAETRLLLFELRPPLLEEQGLAAALRTRLQAVEARAGLDVTFESRGTDRLPLEVEQELFRLAQEALNNVLKHAHASTIRACLDISASNAVLEIADDGVGFEPSLRGGGGFGMQGMRERVERLGGTLSVESAPGGGARVRAEVPR